MKEDSDFYLRLMGIAPEPKPEKPLYDLLGLDPPPLSVPAPVPTMRRMASLADSMRGAPTETPVVPFGEFGAPPLARLSSLAAMVGLPTPPPALSAAPAALYPGVRSLIGPPAMQPLVPAPTGIRFLDALFSEPKPLFSEWLPTQPGLYAVLVFDFTGKPRPYRPIYFGKTENLSERVTSSHEKYGEWRATCQSLTGLYLAYHVMRGSSDWQRCTLERNLITNYAPQCNDVFNPFAGLLGL